MTYAEQQKLRAEAIAKASAKVEALKELGWEEVQSFDRRYSILLPKSPEEYEILAVGLTELPDKVYLVKENYWYDTRSMEFEEVTEYRRDPGKRRTGLEPDVLGQSTWSDYSHYYAKDGTELSSQSVAGAINHHQTRAQQSACRASSAARAWGEEE